MGCGLNIEDVNCRLNALSDAFDALAESEGVTQNILDAVYATGTAYTVTDTAAAVVTGTLPPANVITEPGTYLILARAQIEYAAATVAAETLALKLRRTNNTAADIASSPVSIDLPIATTLTHTYGVVMLPPVIYTTANADDSLTIFANVSAALGAGAIAVSQASVVAIRLY
jgi:hypothetical protein